MSKKENDVTKPKPKPDDLFNAKAGETISEKPPAPMTRAPARAKRKNPEPAREGRAVVVGPPGGSHDVPPKPVNLLALIGQAIVNPAIDASKLTALVDWYDKREADNAFARDFLAMSKELPEITQDGLIDQGITRSGRQGVKARYATFPNIHAVTSPILQKHGFTLSTRNELRGEQTVIVLRLEHYDQRFGSSFRESVQPILRDDGPGKTVVQAWGSGEQYQLRRMVIKLLNLRSRAPDDDDKDGADPAKVAATETKKAEAAKPINAAQLRELRAKIALTGGRITDARVCEKAGVEKLEDVPMAKLPDLYKALDNVIEASRG